MTAPHVVNDEMRSYYECRAREYDDWWLGTGLFADRKRPGWSEEVRGLEGVVRELPPARVLDVGCGTGFLTRHLRGEVVALDQSPRMLELATAREDGDVQVPDELLNYPARSRAGKQLRVIPH